MRLASAVERVILWGANGYGKNAAVALSFSGVNGALAAVAHIRNVRLSTFVAPGRYAEAL